MNTPKIGMGTMIAICVGVVIVQGAMTASLEGVGIGGLSFIAALLIAYVLALFNAMTFSELALMYPEAGTLAVYTKKALGNFPAIVAVFSGYVVVAMLGIPVEMFLIDAIFVEIFGDIMPLKVVPTLILLFFMWTNYRGIDLFAKIQNLLSYSMLTAVFFLSISSIVLYFKNPLSLNDIATISSQFKISDFFKVDSIKLLGIAMWLFLGVEFLCPMINGLKKPKRNLPRAMFLSLAILFLMFFMFIMGGSLYLTADATTSDSPLLYLDYAKAVFGKWGIILAAIMAFTATCSTVNTVLASIPRMLEGMAEDRQAFPQMKILSKYNTPIWGIIFVALIIWLPVMILRIDILITLVISAAISWLLAYMIAHIDVIILRIKEPHQHRPYKTPFYPIPQVLGLIGLGYVVINNAPTPEQSLEVLILTGSILLVVSLISIIWIKFFMKETLFNKGLFSKNTHNND